MCILRDGAAIKHPPYLSVTKNQNNMAMKLSDIGANADVITWEILKSTKDGKKFLALSSKGKQSAFDQKWFTDMLKDKKITPVKGSDTKFSFEVEKVDYADEWD